jgi:UDP-N-acetylmuramate dehydrogenase|tara:strand:+ start:1260 stop:2258 length:999 start_codon:yes stop_codon:yes gene_type:complete
MFKNYSLKNYNSFRVNHKANFFLKIENNKSLINFLSDKKFKNEKKLIIGGGSNILFTKDYEGVILYSCIKGIHILEENDNHIKVKVGSGENWDDFVKFCVSKNWYGIENLSLIPGSVGAVPIQNIGAYGVEVKDYIYDVNGIDLKNNTKKTYSNKSCDFEYRDSIFKRELKNNFFVTEVTFILNKNKKFTLDYSELKNINSQNLTIQNVRDKIIEIRNSKLPDPKLLANAGSFFKNPVINIKIAKKIKEKYNDFKYYQINESMVKISAAWLIEKSGWKGHKEKNIGVYNKHALVLVNYSSENGKDIKILSKKIKESVLEKFNVTLEKEVNVF